jgi:DNA-binding XRE family transcriptional regulator
MSATQMGTLDDRDVVRCNDCTLVQFVTRSGRCRKCLVPYEVESPPAPAVTVPAIAPGPAQGPPMRVGEAAGHLLRVIRAAYGLGTVEMARLLGVSRGQVYTYEQGKVDPSPRAIVCICMRLKIAPDAFIAAVEIAARAMVHNPARAVHAVRIGGLG